MKGMPGKCSKYDQICKDHSMFFLLEKHDKSVSGVIVNLLRGVEKANPRGMSQSYRQPKTIELPPFRGEKLLKSTTEVWEICPSCFPAFANTELTLRRLAKAEWTLGRS